MCVPPATTRHIVRCQRRRAAFAFRSAYERYRGALHRVVSKGTLFALDMIRSGRPRCIHLDSFSVFASGHSLRPRSWLRSKSSAPAIWPPPRSQFRPRMILSKIACCRRGCVMAADRSSQTFHLNGKFSPPIATDGGHLLTDPHCFSTGPTRCEQAELA